MSGLDSADMDRGTFLLLPQRKYKAFLPKDGKGFDGRFKADVNVTKKNKYQAPVDVTQEEVKNDEKPTVGLIFRSEPKIFSLFMSFFEPKEVFYIAATSKKTWRHIMEYQKPMVHRISVRAFHTILESGKAGILHRAQLRVGKENGHDATAVTTALVTDYMQTKSRKDKSSTFTLIELSMSLLPEVETEAAHSLMTAISSSEYAQALVTLGLESSALEGGSFVHVLNCFKGSVALQNLQYLNLSHNHVGYTALHKLKLMLHKDRTYLPNLAGLNIASTNAGCAALELFEWKFLRTRPKLEVVDISGNGISLIDDDTSKLLARAAITWLNIHTVDLSFNPLTDDGLLRILKIVMPLEYDKANPNQVPDEIKMQKLVCMNSQIADGTMDHLVQHIKMNRFPHLHTLHLNMNLITCNGIAWFIEPLVDKQLPALRDLGLSMNNLGDDGLIRLANSIILGAIDDLMHLDVSEVGSGLNNINYFAKCLVDRDALQRPTILKLKTLGLYGRQPFMGKKKARLDFPPSFIQRVKVS